MAEPTKTDLTNKGVSKIGVAAAFILGLPLAGLFAWFGGNVIFGILADGIWIFDILRLILRPTAFYVLTVLLLWLCRIVIFICMIGIPFAKNYEKRHPPLLRKSDWIPSSSAGTNDDTVVEMESAPTGIGADDAV